MTLNKWSLLLAAVMAITAPGISYAQFGALGGAAKNKAVEVLTNKVMEGLEKKFTEIVAKEPISDAAKANIVAKLSEMSRPIVKQFIDGATSGKLPNPAELTQAVLNDILPRVPDLIAAAGTEGGGTTADSTQPTSIPASAIQPAARPETLAPVSGDGVIIYNRHFYVRFDKTMTWTEAKTYSESLGGHLATITSQAEQEAVYLLIKDGKKNFYWLGGYREGKNWQYVTGENFTYNNWIPGKPDNANNQEDKLIMSRISTSSGGKPGQWDDFSNNGDANNMGYIFEFDNAVQPAAPAPTQTAQKATQQSTKTQPAVYNNTPPSESAVVFAGNGHKYEVFDASKTWSEAREDCKRRGGYLVTITSKEEQEFINDLLSKQGKKNNYWLGGYSEKKIWQWVTGEDFTYKNWAPKEPNNAYGRENKLELWKVPPNQSQWGDNANSGNSFNTNPVNYIGYICEWDDTGTTGDVTAVSAAQTTAVFAGNGHKYEIIDTKKTWSEAREDCEKRGGYLATITSNEENEFIKDLFLKLGKKYPEYWLGGYREGNKANENWKWVTGEDFSYTNWNKGQPDNYQKKENKLHLFGSFKWNDAGDNWKIGYICEWD